MRLSLPANFYTALTSNGWAVLQCSSPRLDLVQIAHAIGEPIRALSDSTLEVLKPKATKDARPNTTSGIHGLSAFPPHTDMAHWPVPPRFLAMRTRKSIAGIPTQLLDRNAIKLDSHTKALLRRSVWRIGRVRQTYLCSVYFDYHGQSGIRWDTCTMIPHGQIATDVRPRLLELIDGGLRNERVEHEWTSADDVLVINNWRILHARPEIPDGAIGRELERVLIGDYHCDKT
jgi:L-asparagine oxygenase